MSAANLSAFRNLPEVNFITKTFDQILSELITGYESAYETQTGDTKVLQPGDPIRIFLYTLGLVIYQQQVVINDSAKQNLLTYARDEFLDGLGALVGETRDPASPALDIERFTLSAVQAGAVLIPLGTRVSAGDGVQFQTTEAGEIPAGQLTTDIQIEAVTPGVDGNGYTTGQLNVLVDPIPFVASVTNLGGTQGGSDIEDDTSFSERIYLKPASFSVAGPIGAYVFYTKSVSAEIGDVNVTSPSPGSGQVLVEFILNNGDLPAAGLITEVGDALNADNVRPLTDIVTVQAPAQTSYDLEFTYYISTANAATASDIQADVDAAVDEYILWQKSVIGRDINPDKLVELVRAAGAKRLSIVSPAFTPLTTTVALENIVTVTYGGLEDE